MRSSTISTPCSRSKARRSEEHTSELQSRQYLVCRPGSTLFPYTTLFRSGGLRLLECMVCRSSAVPAARPERGASALVDVRAAPVTPVELATHGNQPGECDPQLSLRPARDRKRADRKSTRLNSSHANISYAAPALHSFPTRRSSDLAAYAYWSAWSAVPVPFPPRDRSAVPQHWLTFGQRQSPLSNSPRMAINPANAILNYLYALLEIESAQIGRAHV